MTKNDLCLLFCTPDGHLGYDEQKLNRDDVRRIQMTPKRALQPDWQSSRYLKQLVPPLHPTVSISHKKGHAALIATTLAHAPIGIDIEYGQHRDFLALAQLCCTTAEQSWLQQQPCLNTAFYQLWTLKESLIKAHRGQLADMKQWSLIDDEHAGIHLPLTATPLRGYSALLADQWLISLVYPRTLPALSPRHCQGLGQWHAVQPQWQAWPSLDGV